MYLTKKIMINGKAMFILKFKISISFIFASLPIKYTHLDCMQLSDHEFHSRDDNALNATNSTQSNFTFLAYMNNTNTQTLPTRL